MKNTKCSKKALIKYILLQIPATILFGLLLFWSRQILEFPVWIVWAVLLLWITKDVVLFFFVWPAYEEQPDDGRFSLIGHVGVTRERLALRGYIRIKGTLWRAKLAQGFREVQAGSQVRVTERNGLTLTVQPLEKNTPVTSNNKFE